MMATIVLTGASSGIGLHLYNHLVSINQYSKIVCICRTQPSTLRSQDDFIPCDFRNSEDLTNLVESLSAYKSISALVHCAGVMHTMPSNKVSIDKLNDMFQVNTIAPAFLTSRCIRPLARARGAVIFISSIAADINIPGELGYSSSKSAVSKLAQNFNAELNKLGIRFFTIAPSYLATPMTSQLSSTQVDSLVNMQSNPKILELSSVCQLIVSALSLPDCASGSVLYAQRLK